MQIGFNTAQNRANVGFSGYLIHARGNVIEKVMARYVQADEMQKALRTSNLPPEQIAQKRTNIGVLNQSADMTMEWIKQHDEPFTAVVKMITNGIEGLKGATILRRLVQSEEKRSGAINNQLKRQSFKKIGEEHCDPSKDKFEVADLRNLADYFERQAKKSK